MSKQKKTAKELITLLKHEVWGHPAYTPDLEIHVVAVNDDGAWDAVCTRCSDAIGELVREKAKALQLTCVLGE